LNPTKLEKNEIQLYQKKIFNKSIFARARKRTFHSIAKVIIGKEKLDRLVELNEKKLILKKMGLSHNIINKTKKRITYVGWLAHDNLGDEALYQANSHIFKPYLLIPEIGYPQYSKITLFGGGTFFPVWGLKIIQNKYNYAYGVRVKNPSFWGKFETSDIDKLKNFNFRYIGVRDISSKYLLKDWGLDSEVIGDPCFLLDTKIIRPINRNMKKIAINVGSDGLLWGGNELRVYKEVVKLCKILKKNDYDPILIPFWKNNINDIQKISKITKTPIFQNWRNTQETINLINSCGIMIGERLHSIIFSALTHTPFISIEYRPKCRDFAETMGFEKYVIRTDKIKSQIIISLLKDLLNDWENMNKKLIKKVNYYSEKLDKFAKIIIKDIEINLG